MFNGIMIYMMQGHNSFDREKLEDFGFNISINLINLINLIDLNQIIQNCYDIQQFMSNEF